MHSVPTADDPLIVEYLKSDEGRAKKNTYENRRTALWWFNEFLRENDLDLREVDPFDIESFAEWLISDRGPGVADLTAKGYIIRVSGFYSTLVRRTSAEERNGGESETGIRTNPVEDADLRNVLHSSDTERTKALRSREDYFALTPEQMKQMVEHAPAPRFRNQLILKALGSLGCRPGELRNLRVEDVDLDEMKVNIRAEKTESNRTVFYKESLQFYLRQWLDTYRNMYKYADTSPYLFPTNRGEKLGKRTLVGIVDKAAENAGLQEALYSDSMGRERNKVTAYAFRHGFAEVMKEQVDASVLKDLMGHADVSTTLKYYAHNREETLRDAAELAPDI